jgi:hypothetical protein
MLGVWIDPVTAQVMMTLPWAAAMVRFYSEKMGTDPIFS